MFAVDISSKGTSRPFLLPIGRNVQTRSGVIRCIGACDLEHLLRTSVAIGYDMYMLSHRYCCWFSHHFFFVFPMLRFIVPQFFLRYKTFFSVRFLGDSDASLFNIKFIIKLKKMYVYKISNKQHTNIWIKLHFLHSTTSEDVLASNLHGYCIRLLCFCLLFCQAALIVIDRE